LTGAGTPLKVVNSFGVPLSKVLDVTLIRRTAQIYDHAARLRSYEILAGAHRDLSNAT
jgi:hypothetical protein